MISANAAMTGFYDYGEAARSVLIAIAASYAALDLAGRVTAASGRARLARLSGGAIAMGIGIWAMHFKAMLAFRLPVSVKYQWPTVLLSLVIAILAAAFALYVASREKFGSVQALTGSVIMGGGIATLHYIDMAAMRLPAITRFSLLLVIFSILLAVLFSLLALQLAFDLREETRWSVPRRLGSATLMGVAVSAMHYTGMAGMRSSATMGYDPVIVAASVAIAIIASFVALAITRNLIYSRAGERPWLKRVGAALLLGFAVVGMHYTGMAAASFQRGSANWRPTAGLVLGTYQLGLIVAIVSVFVLLIALAATQFERWTIATRGRFENLLELAPQVIWFAQPDGRLVYCNPYWYDYTGLPERATLGEGWISAIHPDDRERVAGTWQAAIQTGNDYEVELRLRDRHGGYCWFLARSRPSRDESGNVSSWLGIAMDIEERKKAEEEALAASLAKSEFLASMSHELRTPLNAIGGYAELLALGVRGSLNADQAQDVARIRRSQQHLLTLINDVLNFAKVDAGQAEYRLTAVPVDEALHDTETMIAPQIVAKGLRYSYKGGDKTASVLADPEKLQQIVLNLLTNAVKFTDAGGSITLSAKPRGNCIEISVADTGAGISPEKLERIFDPFVQAERRLNQPVQGVGLGLAISRDLAQAMDGEITVESTVGKGSTFTLSLPRAPRMDPADVPRPADLTDHAGSAREELSDRPFQEASHS